MKNQKTRLLLAWLFLCAVMPASSQEKSADAKKLESASVELDEDADQPAGGETAVDKLKSEFKVDDVRIQGLRDQKLGYGGVSKALSLAQGLPGGITDANVRKVMTLRQGPPVMGWGNVAKELGLNQGSFMSRVKKISAEVRKRAKADKAKKDKKAGEKMEKPEKPEKAGKLERPGKGGHPESPGKH